MSMRRFDSLKCAALALAIGICSAGPSAAGDVNVTDLVSGLAPEVSRSLSSTPSNTPEQSADDAFVNTIHARNGELSGQETAKLDQIVADRKQVDLELEFGYNSNKLTTKALKTAAKIGEALQSPKLRNQR
jgi:hypothetical protein